MLYYRKRRMIYMLRKIVKLIEKELETKREVRYLEQQLRWKYREASEHKEKAIEAFRKNKHLVGKSYMTRYDTTYNEIDELHKKIDNFNKE